MRLLIYLAIAAAIYVIWSNVTGRNANPFGEAAKIKSLKYRILLILRGNEDAFLRMYQREESLYPDLAEIEILERILYSLENDR